MRGPGSEWYAAEQGLAARDTTSMGELEFQGTDRFSVVRRLGSGGMGVVYEAVDRDLGTRVALKTLRSLTADALLRFKNEFRAAQDIRHSNLISFGELFEAHGDWFFTMELIEGTDLISWVRGPSGARSPEASSGTRHALAFHETVAHLHDSTATIVARDATSPGTGLERSGVIGPVAFDQARIRDAFAQVGRGLLTLHAAGMVHRDIKPSNILVTPDGRVVILDFGLVRSLGSSSQNSGLHPVGTIAYMAPEQAAAASVGPPADWYAVGVMLYEALTGRLPFSGNALDVLLAKQQLQIAPPSVLDPKIPSDLDALCEHLLARDPASRPSGREVLRALGAEDDVEPSGVTAIPVAGQPHPFVGRRRELGLLRAAFEETRRGVCAAAVVEGVSGVGKSALVKQFTDHLRTRTRGVIVLAGRCYERESIPFKAFDGVVDALSRYLSRAARSDVDAVLPPDAHLLAHVFPVLRAVEPIARAGRAAVDLNPQELRGRVFASLRTLFDSIARRQALTLVIDDLQWADRDSLELLARLLGPPDPPPLLLVVTLRSEGDRAGAALPLEAATTLVEVKPLPADEAEELATLLLEGQGRREQAHGIAREAAGHPLLIDELARQFVAAGARPEGTRLEDALGRRVAALPEGQRPLLELLAVTGLPIRREVVVRASGLSRSDAARAVTGLQGARLVRASGSDEGELEVSHDRIREVLVARLDGPSLRARHERIALALEADAAPDVQALFTHWRGAGQAEKAAQYGLMAADLAVQALAFDRAAALYREARGMWPPGKGPRVELGRKLGTALAHQGWLEEAAEVYASTAKEATPHEALELHRQAAELLLRGGFLDQALELLRCVLARAGMPLPETTGSGLLWRRLLVRIGGLRFVERDANQVPASELARLDLAWSVYSGLGLIDPIWAAHYQALHLRGALRLGEPERATRALASEVIFHAMRGHPEDARAARLEEQLTKVARRASAPYTEGYVELAHAMASYLRGSWRQACDRFTRAEAVFRDRCSGVMLEQDLARVGSLWCLYYLGALGDLSRRVPILHREAQERGDLLAATSLRAGNLNLTLLAADDPTRARAQLHRVMTPWLKGVHVPRLWGFIARCNIHLYTGEPAEAHRLAMEVVPSLERSRMLRVGILDAEVSWAHARVSLAAALALTPHERRRADLLRTAERRAARLRSLGPRWAQGLGDLVAAGVLAARRERSSAFARLEAARETFEACEMGLLEAVARRGLGCLQLAGRGDRLIEEAEAWMQSQRIKHPGRLAAVLAPGLAE